MLYYVVFYIDPKNPRMGKTLLMLLSSSPLEDSEVELFKVT